VERNLLSQFKGEAKVPATDARAEPSLALSLRAGSQEEPLPLPQNRLRFWYAPTRQSPTSLLSRPGGSSVPSQTYAPPGSSPAGAGLAPPPQLRSNSVHLPPPEPRCGACSVHYGRLAADLLKRVSGDLDRRVGLLRQELSAEVRNEVLRLHAAAAAGLPAQQPQPYGGGAWCWCPACGTRPGTVGLKPYEHLCLCAQCSADSRLCPVCSFTTTTWTGAVVEAASRGVHFAEGSGGL